MIPPVSQAKGTLFTVVVSEKGGADRRESFERSEITVGRVQGNDLMLPKGNVSKRHARVVFRDSRFIVTDLNSTNGTYVNRRRISQATIVREGDRIYVGDFVLQIEPSETVGSSTNESTGSGQSPSRSMPSSAEIETPASSGVPRPSTAEPLPDVPGPPRVPTGARASAPGEDPGSDSFPAASVPRAEVARPSVAAPSPPAASPRFAESASARALRTLVMHVTDLLEPGALDRDVDDTLVIRIEQLIDQQAASVVEGSEGGGALSRDALVRAARAELLELGPLGALLEDREVSDVTVSRFDHIMATRAGAPVVVDPPFSSEGALRRAVLRACRRAGAPASPDAAIVECRLLSGAQLWAVTGRAAPGGTAVVLRKPERAPRTLEELVRSGTISRAMATCLGQCVAARASVLVVGPRDSGASAIVGALAASGHEGEIVSIEDSEPFTLPGNSDLRLSVASPDIEVQRLVRGASRLPAARLVVDVTRSEVAAAVLEAIGEGADGVVACLPAASVSRALSRLAADVLVSRPGVGIAAAREIVAGAFDLVVEVGRLRDGRQRVMRVCQIAGVNDTSVRTEDVFVFTVERTAAGGAVEGSFHASGVVPSLVEALASRGVSLDHSLYTRPPSR